MKKKIKWAAGGLVVVFVLLQLTNPAHINPPVKQDLIASITPPPKIAGMLHAACYDCHSNETKWPWYSYIAPVSWLVVKDVNDGRDALNFSDWPSANPERAARRLSNMSEEIGYDEMPPKKYTSIHAEARFTESERKELIDWLDAEAKRLKETDTN